MTARFYRALLRLYPAGFLADYRHELCAAFAERARDISGPLAPARVALAALADVVPNAAAVHAEMLRQDARHAARSLRRAPAFALTAVALVALGVGVNTAAFSLADFVLLRPLPYPEADRLVKVYQTTPGGGRNELSPAMYREWAAASERAFAGFGAYTSSAANLTGVAEPRRVDLARVTPGLLDLVGTRALAGRTINAADSADAGVVVLGHAFWRAEFGGADVVGSVVRLDGVAHTVVGVMPPAFRFPDREVDAWTPLVLREDDFVDRSDTYLKGVARLRAGVSFERAREELAAVAARAERPYEAENGQVTAASLRLRDELAPRARLLVLALCGAALCILLLACANLAGLLLARAAQRSRELAVRSALGAGRERLVRQLATESAGLAVVGGAAGVALAALGLPLLARLVPPALPAAEHLSVDARVLGIAAAAVAATALLFGVLPAARGGRARGVFDALRGGARAGGESTRRLRAALVVVEVAASVVLLVASGLLVRAVWRIQATEPGFRAERVLTLRTALPLPAYAVTARRAEFYRRVLDEVRATPGVQGAAYVTGLPMRMTGGIWKAALPGEPTAVDGSRSVSLRFVTPQYFATLGIPLRRGRDVAEADGRGRPLVAVVSEAFARRHWPNADPIGKRFTLAFAERAVVGVVGDVRVRGREQPSEPQVYLPYQQVEDSALIGYTPKDLVIRSAAPAAALVPAVRRAVRAADPEQPVSDVATLAEIVAAETAPRVAQLRLLAALSAGALLIAGVGVYGLLAYTVSRRSQELAVRRALGASGRGIVTMVLGEGLLLAGVGVVVGAAAAYPAARAMGALLAGVGPADPLTLGAVAALCLATAVAGCLRPAVRAARVAPLAALRAE